MTVAIDTLLFEQGTEHEDFLTGTAADRNNSTLDGYAQIVLTIT